jgi:hypothetical protein
LQLYKSAITALFFVMSFSTQSFSQFMTYENHNGASDFIDHADKGNKNKLLLDSEIELLGSNLTFERWSSRQRNFFEKQVDLNNDGVISEIDLHYTNAEELKSWTKSSIDEIFNFWAPNFEVHLADLKKTLEISSKGDELIVSTTESSFQSIKFLFEKTGITGQKLGETMVTAKIGDPTLIRDGVVAKNHRKWFAVQTPILVVLNTKQGLIEYSASILVLVLTKHKNFEGDSNFILWEISAS